MKIISIPNPVLFQKTKKVGAITPKIKELLEGMKIALAQANNPKGVGLAAPQVGKSLRLFIVRTNENQPFSIFINPEIVSRSEEIDKETKLLEGCLSIPSIWGPVKRYKEVKIRYQTPEGKTQEESFSGLMATTIQHEMDHLDGLLFTARVVEQKGKLYHMEKDKEGNEVFDEIKI